MKICHGFLPGIKISITYLKMQRTHDSFYLCRSIKFFSATVIRQDNTRQTVMHICG